MAARFFSNIVSTGTLAVGVGTGDTTLSLTGFSGLPSFPFYIVVDRDTISEEAMLATGGNAANLIVTRGYDGTTAFAHSPGARVQHAALAEHFNKADTHVEASANVHGLSGGAAVVGTTQSQTLTNKTINASVVNVAHSTSPAATDAVKVAADAATARNGFVWDNTGSSTGAAFKAVSGGTDRFTVSANGLVAINSTTGSDQVFKTQQAGVDRAIITAAGAATVTSLTSSGAVSGTTGTYTGLVTGDALTVTNAVTAKNAVLNSTTATDKLVSVSASGTERGFWRANGQLELPVPLAGNTDSRLVVRGVASGGNGIEYRNSSGNIGFFVSNTGGVGINNSAGVGQFTADTAGIVVATDAIRSFTNKVTTTNHGGGNYGATSEIFHVTGAGTATDHRELRQPVVTRFQSGGVVSLTGSEAVLYEMSWAPRNTCHADINGFVHFQAHNGGAAGTESSECIARLKIYTDPGLVLVYDSAYDFTTHTFDDNPRNIQTKSFAPIVDASNVEFAAGSIYRIRLLGLSGSVMKSNAIGFRLVVRESVRAA